MRHRLLLSAVSGALALAVVGALSGSASASFREWSDAVTVPGTVAFNSGGYAIVNSVSCPSADNCSAGGDYVDGSGNSQAFVVDQTNGDWGNAIEVPGTAALDSGGYAVLESVSCTAAGWCAAGGSYLDHSGNQQAFIVDETNGTWGTAVKVPGTATLNSGGSAVVNSVSCTAAGYCAAGGSYKDGAGKSQAFVVEETNGTWGNATEVPNSGALNGGGYAVVNTISCHSTGNCAAGGTYIDGTSELQGFLVDETNGTWGNAHSIPGIGALDNGGTGDINSISCAGDGSCTAGGEYSDGGTGLSQAFVVDETNGTWGTAIEVPGIGSLNGGGYALLGTVSCSSAGTCAAGGSYVDGSGNQQAFVADETSGTWGSAAEVPGTDTLNAGGNASLQSVSCPADGSCAGGGTFADGSGQSEAFVADETNGSWGNAIEVPGMATLNNGGTAEVTSVSCATDISCTAAGSYFDTHDSEAFVVTSVNSTRTDQTITVTTPAPASAVYGTKFTVAATGGGSGNPVTYHSAGGCTNAGAQFTMTSGSTDCTVKFDEAGNSNYNPATEVTETVTAQKASQTISVTTHAPASAVYGASFGVAATAPGGTVSFSSSGSCTNVTATFTMTSGTGTCTVKYDQAGDANYAAASQVTESTTAQKATQSINFSPLNGHTYGDADFDPGATASSGLTVSYGASGNCLIVNGMVHLTGAGSCTVTASQAGNANYNAASDVQHGFSIGQASLTITASDQQKPYGQSLDLGTSAFTPSGLVGSDSISAVTLTSAGSGAGAAVGNYAIVPSAAVAGNGTNLGNYSVTYTNGTLQVKAAAQTITFAQPSNRTWGDADFDPGATASSGLTVSYGASGNCTIVSGLVHLTGAGSCTVTASQAGNASYAPAADVQRTFSIAKYAVTVTAGNQQKLRHLTLALGTKAFTTSPLVGSDSISSVTLTSAGSSATAAPGVYPIVPSAAVAGGGTNLANYAITFANGSLTVLNGGLVGLKSVTVSTSGGMIDSFDSSHGAYKGSNHASAALVLSNGAVSLAGVAVGGDVTGSIVSLASSASVSGLVTQAAPSPPIAVPAVAKCAAFSTKGIKGGKFVYSTKTGNLKVVKGTVKLANGTYCFNNVTLAPKSMLAVSGPVTIHLRGKLNGSGQLVNKTNKDANLHIDTSFKGANGIAIAGNNHAYMTVVAPGTTVTVAGGSYFGTLLAGTVKLTGKTAFHADTH